MLRCCSALGVSVVALELQQPDGSATVLHRAAEQPGGRRATLATRGCGE